MKYIRSIIFIAILALSGAAIGPSVASAQCVSSAESGEYCLISPLPDLGESITPESTSLAEYIGTLYQYGVGIAIVLAIIVIVIGGIEYMTSASADGKASGRGRVTAALIGLLLALGSYGLLVLVGGEEAVDVDLAIDVEPVTAPPEPVEPEPGEEEDSEIFCSASFEITESNWGVTNPDNYASCPLSFGEKLEGASTGRVFGSTAELTEEELVQYRNSAGTTTLPDQCYFQSGVGQAIVDIDMGQCEAQAEQTGLLDPGDPLECFNEVKDGIQFNEKEIFCGTGALQQNERGAQHEYEEIVFKLDFEDAPFDESGSCYQLSRDEVISFAAQDECAEAGGQLRTFNSAPLNGTYCVAESTQTACAEALEGEFMTLAGFDDEYWDENLCDVRSANIPQGVTVEQRQDLEGLFDDFSNNLGLSTQTSGYYNDEHYEHNHSPDEEPHAGIDLDGGTGDAVRAPVSGEVVKLWNENDAQYTNNGKVGIIDENGRLWVFTHIQNMENVGQTVEAGTKIAEVGVDASGGSHLHLEVHNDANVAYNGGNPQAPYNEGLRGGLHDGTMTESQAQQYTMCPLQTYWESINGVSS